MFDYKNCDLEEFWKHVASHLEEHSIGVTLVGGAVATIYSEGGYESGDLDMVFDSMFQDRNKFLEVLKKIGIEKVDQRNFKHPDCPFSLEAKAPPVDIGHMAPEGTSPEIKKEKVKQTTIKILSPTDCIKDRLYKADEWDDDEAFEAAILVAKKTGFNERKLEDFFELNRKIEIFEKFKKTLSSKMD